MIRKFVMNKNAISLIVVNLYAKIICHEEKNAIGPMVVNSDDKKICHEKKCYFSYTSEIK